DRERAVTLAARELGVASEALLQSLFADLRDERRVRAPEPVLPVAELARHANLALVSSLIKRALAITIEGDAALRPVVRQAKLRGLLCTVEAPRGPRAPERLSISGPFALFHRTTLYGRALASIVPLAARCPGMVLRATCNLEGRERTVVVRAGDPLPVSPTGRRFDSKLEERFFRDMTRAAPDWDLLREPRAIPAGGTLVFPDFELQHRRAPTRRWLLEIAGFWTPSYIADKLAPLRAAHLDHFILCIDEARNCAPEELPSHARVVRYDKRIDPAAILAIIDP
ncbi:MAG: DUF790 family protein, partial [Myxococcales bacterium]|nr:DUF790 family protein [Myxococcales bacterium]